MSLQDYTSNGESSILPGKTAFHAASSVSGPGVVIAWNNQSIFIPNDERNEGEKFQKKPE
jgi:hypothetical protein